jgi:putative DeoR family transcriptional regulator, stage III sporulation protein D
MRKTKNAVKAADRIDKIECRTIEEAIYILGNSSTTRKTARVFSVSKSTTHNDLKNKLPLFNMELAKKVNILMAENWNTRYVKGGEATRRKYQEHSHT